METAKIDFVDNATTKEAGVYAMRYGWAFAKGACRDVNKMVHEIPWVCMEIVVMGAVLVSFVCISKAHADRDRSLKRQAQLQQQVEQLQIAVGASRQMNTRLLIK